MTQDLYYYESGYFTPDTGYFVYTADAESAVSSNFTVSATAENIKGTQVALTSAVSTTTLAGIIKEAASALSSAFTQEAMISHIEGADLFAMSNAALVAAADRIRDNNVLVTSAYTITADAERVRYYSSAQSTSADIVADNLRVRYSEAAVNAAFSLAVPGERIQQFASDQSTAFTQSSTEDYLRRTSADLSSAAEFYCDPERIPGGVIVSATGSWTSAFTVTGSIINIHGTDLSAFSNAALSVSADRTRDLLSEQTASSALTVTVLKIQSTDSALSNSTTVDAQSAVTRFGSGALTSSSSLSGTISHIEGADLSAFTNAAMTVSANRFRSTPAALSSAATVSAAPYTFTKFTAALASAATVSATALKTRQLSAALSSTSTVSATATELHEYWYETFQTSTGFSNRYYASGPVAIDSQQNIIFGSFYYASSFSDTTLIKTDRYGTVIWAKTFTIGSAVGIEQIVVDVNDNIYFSTSNFRTLFKLDSSGTVIWRRTYTADVVGTIAVDAAGEYIYAASQYDNNNIINLTKIEITSVGNPIWKKRLVGTASAGYVFSPKNLKIDTAGNLHMTAFAVSDNGTSTYKYGVYLKINPSTFSILVAKEFGSDPIYFDLAPDNSVFIYNFESGVRRLQKFDSSGNVLWSTALSSISISGINADPNDGGVYLSGSGAIAKVNSSGGAEWYKVMYTTAGAIATFPDDDTATAVVGVGFTHDFRSIISSDGTALIAPYRQRLSTSPYTNYSVIAKIPTNGSGAQSSPLSYGTYSFTGTSTSATNNNTTKVVFGADATWIATASISYTDTVVTVSPTQYEFTNVGYYKTASATLASSSTLNALGINAQFGNATLTSSTSLTAQPAAGVSYFRAALSSSFTQSATGKRTSEIALSAFTNAAVSATPLRIKSTTAELTSAFTQTTNVGLRKQTSVSLASAATLTASALDLDIAQAALSSAFSLTATVLRIKKTTAAFSSSATTSISAKRTARITRALTVTSSMTVSGADLDLAQAALTSAFSVYAKQDRYAPRPWKTWDQTNPVPMYYRYSDWNKIYLDDIYIPNTTTDGTVTLLNFGGKKIDWIHDSSGDYVVIGDVSRSISTPGYFNLRATRGQAIQFGSQTYDSWDFDPLVGFTETTIGTNSFSFSASKSVYLSPSSSINKTEIARVVVDNSNYDYVFSFSYNYSNYNFRIYLDQVHKTTSAVTQLDSYLTIITPNQTTTVSVSATKTTYGGSPGAGFGGSAPWNGKTVRTVYSSNGFSESLTGGTTTNVNYPYIDLTNTTGNDLMITRTGFNTNVILGTNPYDLSDQTYVLGLYDAPSAVDRVGAKYQGDAALTSSVSASISARKIILSAANLNSNFSQSTVINRRVNPPTSLQVTATETASITVVKRAASSMSSAFSLAASAKKLNGFTVNINSTASLTAPPYNFTKATASLSSAFTETATILRIQKSTVSMTAFAAELTAAAKIGRGLVHSQVTATLTAVPYEFTKASAALISNFTSSISARKDTVGIVTLSATATTVASPYNFTKAAAGLTSTATVSAANKRIRYSAAGITAIATLTANVTKIKAVQATLTSAFTVAATVKKTTRYTAALTSQSTLSAINVRVRFNSSSQSAQFTQTANNQILRLASAGLQATFTEFVVGGIYVRFEIAMTAFDTVLVAGQVINIDKDLQLKIKPETRALIIEEETRELLIISETRVNIIKD